MSDHPLGKSQLAAVRIQRRMEGLRTMTSTTRNEAARRRGDVSHDGVGRRLSPAIEARRRLNAQRRGTAGSSATRIGLRDPRYDYLTQSHDQPDEDLGARRTTHE
jgi:hypothetical protein